MKKVKLQGLEYMIPESWGDVTVKQFQDLSLHVDIEYKTERLKGLVILSVLIGCDLETLKAITMAEYEELLSVVAFSNEMLKKTYTKKFIVKGVEYKTYDNLKLMSMGNMIDLETIIATSKPNELLGNMLPILIRRFDKDGYAIDYDVRKYGEIKELFLNNLMITDVFHLFDFF